MAINFNNINVGATQTVAQTTQQIKPPFEEPTFSQQVIANQGAIPNALAGLGAIWAKAKESNGAKLPDGKYAAIIEKVQVGDTNDGSKIKIVFVHKVVEGDFANRLEFNNITLNVNDTTVEGVARLEKNLAKIKGIFNQYGIDEQKSFDVINQAYAEFKSQNASDKLVEIAMEDKIGELTIKSLPAKTEGDDPFRVITFKLGK